jgi:Na+/serine symporter
MKNIKRLLGYVWMLLAPVLVFLLIYGAVLNIDSTGDKDINQPIPWLIIIGIFAPIAVGLFIFGLYCTKGEYDRLPESSAEIE